MSANSQTVTPPPPPQQAFEFSAQQFNEMCKHTLQQQKEIADLQNQVKYLNGALSFAAAQSNDRKHRPKEPSVFKGKPTDDVDNWLDEFENYRKLVKLGDDIVVDYAAGYLGEDARTWFRNRQLAEPKISTYQQFQQEIRSRFGVVDKAEAARDKLAVAKQIKSVQAYTTYFTSLCINIPDLSDSEKKDRYLRGLNNNIRVLVKMNRPQTLEECISLAQSIESDLSGSSIQFSTSQSSSSPSTSMDLSVVDSAASSVVSELNAVHRRTSIPLQKPKSVYRVPGLSREEFTRCREAGICFHCKQPGHIASKCQSKNEQPQHDSKQQ